MSSTSKIDAKRSSAENKETTNSTNRENSSKAVSIVQGGGSVKLKQPIARNASTASDDGSARPPMSKTDLRQSISGLISEITSTPSTTPKSSKKSLNRANSIEEGNDTNRPGSRHTLSRQNSSKALLIAQGGGAVKLRKQISRTSSAVKDSGSGTSTVLNDFVDQVLVSSPTSALARQKSRASIDGANRTFDDQINSILMDDIPYVSKAKQMRSIWPVHTSERRYRIMDIGSRLKRNDGGMVRLRLSSEFIDDDLLKIICDNLIGNTTLNQLMLLNNMITDEGVKRLSKSVRRHPVLHTIWLGGNRISDQGVYHLCELLRKNGKIKDLNLSNKWPELRWEKTEHKDHPRITADGASLLARLLSDSHSGGKEGGLYNLCLAEQRIGNKGAVRLFNAIPSCHLRTLNLRGNGLGDGCCSALKVLLASESSNLEFLNVSHNEITDRGVMIFAAALKINRILHAFDLSYNKIDKNGMKVIMECLYENSTMQSISLRCNLYDDPSAEEFLRGRLLDRLAYQIEVDEHAFDAYGLYDDGTKDYFTRNQEAMERSQTEAFRRVSKGNMAMKLVKDLTSDLGAFGKKLPARAHRAESPASLNPFSRQDSANSSPGAHIALQRSHSTDMHSLSRADSYRSDLFSGDEYDDEDFFDTDWKPSSPPLGMNGFSRTHTPDTSERKGIGEENEEHNDDDDSEARKEMAKQTKQELVDPYFDGENPSPIKKAVAEEHVEHQTVVKVDGVMRPSAALGHTRGIPHIGSYVGSLPIRSATTRHRDSANHLMYLKVLTPADPPGTTPYPVVKIAQDRDATRKAELEKRQTANHKLQKRNAILYNKVFGMKEAMEALPPPNFWKEWKMQVHNKYPTGIDRASGCTSIAHLIVKEDKERIEQSKLMLRRRQMAAEYGFEKKQNVQNALSSLPPIPQDAHLKNLAAKRRRHSAIAEELKAIVPPTKISEKYKDESSAVGVGEHYRRTHVNVTAKSDAQRRAQNINVETLMGLSVTETASAVVLDPKAPAHLTTHVKHV